MALKRFLENTLGKVFKNVDWYNVPTGTYVRYILAIVAAVNTLTNVFGINPINIDESQLYDVISALLFIGILFVNTYKDNPTSPEAIESNKFLQQLVEEKKHKCSNPNCTATEDHDETPSAK